MEDYPKTLMEFEARFSTEKLCRDYLFRIRWQEGFSCPRCSCEKVWPIGTTLFQCAKCHYRTSVIAGTIFQDTKKPLRLWFHAMWHLTSQKYGANALGMQRVLGLSSYHVGWTWLHKLRCAMVRPGRDRLSGTVEVDETYIGGEKPGKRGRGAMGKVLVVVMVELIESKVGRIRLKRVPDASGPSLDGAVKESVGPGSIIHTDGWGGYGRLSEIGYAHEVIRKRADVGQNLLPRVNRVVALLKRWLLGTYQGAVRPSHLDYYLDEFTFRFNRRRSRSRGKLFYRLVQQAVAIDPVLAKQIRGGTVSF
jgi:transposase-like protein/ribosomal protein L37AE/L43A